MSRLPLVVIVGRPNVGKSTLFNRLTRSRRALVHDLPGVTRDRIVGDGRRPDGSAVTFVDTGGLMMGESDGLVAMVRRQAETALDNADAVLLVLDGESGLVPEDHEVAAYLRRRGDTVVPVVNKGDRREVTLQSSEFYALGLGDPVVVSAEHGSGIDRLWAVLDDVLPAEESDEPTGEPDEEIRVAIVGRPNVGKSSLLNRLVGEARAIVSEVPGTTRDAVDVVIEQAGRRLRFVDTAGIRRKSRTDKGPEVLSVVMARKQLERAHMGLLVVDGEAGVSGQDARIAGYLWEAGRGLVLVINKWDLAAEPGEDRHRVEVELGEQLRFVLHAPRAYVSAKTGFHVERLFPAMERVYRGLTRQAATPELNDLLHDAWNRHPPSVPGRREAKLYYATQVGTVPPRFALFTNVSRGVHHSYRRYLENILREHFDLAGVPIRVMIRGKKR